MAKTNVAQNLSRIIRSLLGLNPSPVKKETPEDRFATLRVHDSMIPANRYRGNRAGVMYYMLSESPTKKTKLTIRYFVADSFHMTEASQKSAVALVACEKN
jgi:hypothetical protein